MLGIVAWQISTAGRSATAAAACTAGFVHGRLSRGVKTRLAADCYLIIARVSCNGHPADRQDEHCFARSANEGEIATEESEAGECCQSSVEVIGSSHLGAGDSSGFKNGTAPDILRHANRCQATAKHDRRGVREDFYRAPGELRAACVKRVSQFASNLEDGEARLHPAMPSPSRIRLQVWERCLCRGPEAASRLVVICR